MNAKRTTGGISILGATAACVVAAAATIAGCKARDPYVDWTDPVPSTALMIEYEGSKIPLANQTKEVATARSAGCISCHQNTGDPHEPFKTTNLSCVDCHGGDGLAKEKEAAHPKARHPERWKSAANPEVSYTLLNDEELAWIKFVNPGDLRAAPEACGSCHAQDVLNVSKSLMTTAAHFWGTAAYSNGIVSMKKTFLGESYSPDGTPRKVNTVPPPTAAELARSVVPTIVPLPNFEVTQPGNLYRVFEKGSRLPNPIVGLPDKNEDPGRPNNRLSDRGYGTLNRVDLTLLNVHKTRLNDPHLSFLGTNNQPGDYRSSGCTACHVVYANDRNPVHSGPYAAKGHRGLALDNPDPTIKKDEPGHPLNHSFTKAIPSSQCMTCHMHQPNSFLNTYYGFQMWSYETDGAALWPEKRRDPSHEERVHIHEHNPEGAAAYGKWSDRELLANVTDLNPTLKHTQFADYHGHGWIFRGVFKTDRKGNLLDAVGNKIDYDDPDKFKGVVPRFDQDGMNLAPASAEHRRAVHMKDIHAEYGMHCTDCHFVQDVHNDGRIYGEYQAAISIKCEDCHGTAKNYASLEMSGPASASMEGRPDLKRLDSRTYKTPWGKPRFERRREQGRTVYVQRSMVYPDKEWNISQVRDSVDETLPNGKANPEYNAKAAYAKTMRRDGTWGDIPRDGKTSCDLAHNEDNMECYTCHTSWVTSCFGCHMPQQANWKSEEHHFDGTTRRNYATYNPQVARDDAFMLAIPGDVKRAPGQKTKYSTARSSSAVMISSQDAQRRHVYAQQATWAGNGMSSQAFNTHFAHTVRKTETRTCDDCHVSSQDDNNAWLAQTYLLGTNFVNFIGYRAYVGLGEDGFEAVRVTEWPEPQAVVGSNLHRMVYPEAHREFVEKGRLLEDAVHHGSPDARSVALRGEYLYVACGEGGFRAYDVANVNNKDFSEPIVTSPVSPLGQDTHVATKFATAVCLPFNNPISLAREFRKENGETNYPYAGRDQYIHEMYRYAYVTDRYEGLILVDIDRLTDGNPQNNFFERAVTFNPDGVLNGAENLTVAGATVYVCCDRGLVLVDVSDPLKPRLIGEIGAPHVVKPTSVQVQFRYAFVTDAEGLQVIDVTEPTRATAVAGARVKIPGARDVYVARTYAYVSAGAAGLVIVDVERPTAPRIDQTFDGGGAINDLRQTIVGMTNDSVYAYLADGKNGLHVVQLVTPEDGGRSAYGFSPRPKPSLIATRRTHGECLTVAEGMDRDRAVDESGYQVTIFGRWGGRPLDLGEMKNLYQKDGKVWRAANAPDQSKKIAKPAKK